MIRVFVCFATQTWNIIHLYEQPTVKLLHLFFFMTKRNHKDRDAPSRQLLLAIILGLFQPKSDHFCSQLGGSRLVEKNQSFIGTWLIKAQLPKMCSHALAVLRIPAVVHDTMIALISPNSLLLGFLMQP